MNVAAHQINFMPWIGYFLKMYISDHFILADDVQFTKPGFTNRVCIKTVMGQEWLTVPVITKGKGNQLINQITIDNSKNWQQKHWKTLFLNYKNALYFDNYADFFQSTYQKNWDSLSDFNFCIFDFICRELNITTPRSLSSVKSSKKNVGATEHIINMVKSVDGNTYISGQSGKKYLKEQQFGNHEIELKYISFEHPLYHQQFGKFIPGLSVIDLLFNEGPSAEKILKAVNVNLESYPPEFKQIQS